MVPIAWALLVAATVSHPTQEQPRRPSFHAISKRVYIDVFVSDQGRPLLGLTKEDFDIIDASVPQPDFTVLDGADQPLSVVLLLDTSRSVSGSKLQQLQTGASAFIDALFDTDAVAVLGFNTRFRLLSSAAAGHGAAKNAIRLMRGGGATAFFDSLDTAIALAESGPGRPLVVAFTDGADNSSWLSSSDAIDSAKRSPTVIFSLRLTSGAGIRLRDGTESEPEMFFETETDRIAHQTLEEITRAGGGELVSLQSSESLATGFASILDQMHQRYILVYEPSAARPGWHPLRVTVKTRPDVLVRARAGYFMR